MIETLRIVSRNAAAALNHARARQIVLELVANELSLQELANATGLSLSLLHYHVTRLRALGLVRIAKKDRRPGRSVNRYRAVARRFVVPAQLAKDSHGDALARELRAGLDRERATGNAAGVAYFVDATGVHRMRRLLSQGQNSAFEVWFRLFLSSHDGEQLANDIRALFTRYSQRRDARGRPVLAYCAFAARATSRR
jgi:DNA-binding transcriptional ArsR family regulator